MSRSSCSDVAAAELFDLAAAQGDSFAQVQSTAPPSPPSYPLPAAALSHCHLFVSSQVNLAHMYEVGQGVSQDTQKAAQLYR
jgi:hypothetical protein